MWLFLATEIMFFTGLIGSYIVLRAGSPHTAYSNLYPPTTSLERIGEHLRHRCSSRSDERRAAVEEILQTAAGLERAEGREDPRASVPHGRRHRPDQARRPRRFTTGSTAARGRRRGRAAQDPQLAHALRRADQPAGHQPDGRQHLRADLLVGHDGPGPRGHPARASGRRARSSCGRRSSSARSSWASRSTNITS